MRPGAVELELQPEGSLMGLFDLTKPLRIPGDLAKQAAKDAAQLPAVPFDVADKVREGVEEGIEELTDPKAGKRR